MIANPETFSAPNDIDNTEPLLETAVASRPAPPACHSAAVFHIPPEQAAAALRAGVPAEVLTETRQLLAIVERVAGKKIRPECERQSRLSAFRWSRGTLVAHYYKFMHAVEAGQPEPWRVLLNKAKAPSGRANTVVLKFAFYEFWRKLGEEHQRCWSAAHTELVQIWKTGFGFPRNSKPPQRYTKIPGYNEWPNQIDAGTGLPVGWSQTNLMRKCSDKYDQAAARVGRSKASEHRLPVLTSRVGLKFMEYVEFDDHEFNQKVMFQKKPMRPLGFGAVECLSGGICHFGIKPTLWDFEDEVKKKLTEREFMWFVVSFLMTVGYRNDATGTELIVERGTAAIRDAFRERIARVFGGRVTVFVGGRFGRGAHDGQFAGRSHGNFKTKRLVEGMWSLVDNQLDALPAQVGKDRNFAPEQLYGMEQYTKQLLARAEKAELPMSRCASLEFPIAPFYQWREWALDAVQRINQKRDRDLEGWEKLGYVVPSWQLDAPLVKAMTAMPPEQRDVVKNALLTANPDMATTTRLNSQEVMNLHRKELTRAPFELLPELAGLENALNGGNPLEVKRGLLTFEDGELDADPLHFYARDISCRTASNHLPNGEKYICFVNPYDPRVLVACEQNASGKLRVVACCPRYELPCKNDEHAVRVRMGEANAWEAAHRQNLNLRHADSAADLDAMKRHNEQVFEGKPITPTEKVQARKDAARAKSLRNYSGDVSELAGEVQSPNPEVQSQPDMAELSQPAQLSTNDSQLPESDHSAEGLL